MKTANDPFKQKATQNKRTTPLCQKIVKVRAKNGMMFAAAKGCRTETDQSGIERGGQFVNGSLFEAQLCH